MNPSRTTQRFYHGKAAGLLGSLFLLCSAVLPFSVVAQNSSDRGPVIGLAIEPAGYAVYPIATKGVEASYYLSPLTALSASYARGTSEQLLAKSDAQLTILRFKYFFGAISHINLGIGERSIGYRYSVKLVSDESKDVTVGMSALVTEVSFGNQLHFGPVQLGCDWLGAVFPLVKLKNENNFPADAADAEAESESDAVKKVAFVPSLQFMRLFVGVVF